MIGFYWQNNVSPWEIPVLITERVEVALVTTEKPCTAHSACVLYPSVQSDSRCPHVAAELLSHVTSRTGSWTLSRRVKFERSHMATILDSPAFSNCKFSLICARSPTSFSRPASNTVGILRRALYKLLHLSLIP